jgi:hypothetical protein
MAGLKLVRGELEIAVAVGDQNAIALGDLQNLPAYAGSFSKKMELSGV